MNRIPTTSSRCLFGLAAAALALAPGIAWPQYLLKDGQGLAGSPEAIPENPKDGEAPVTQLPEVKVDGELDPLTAADRKRRAQAKKLPGLGTEVERTPGTAEKVLDFYNGLETDPNNLSAGSQEFLDRAVNSPNDNHRDDYVSVPRRDRRDYVDPIAAEQKATGQK